MSVAGDRLRAARRRAGMSQERLAQRSGISRGAIQRIEAGGTDNPHPETLVVLAKTLGVEPCDLEPLPAATAALGLPASDAGDAASERAADPREGLARAPFGRLPRHPPVVVGRGASVDQIRTHLLASRGRVGSASVPSLVALVGSPGVGKTTLAALLAHDPALHEEFPDGLLWSSLGESADVRGELASWCRVVGLPVDDDEIVSTSDLSARMAHFMRNKRALLVVDDLWAAADLEFLRVGGAACATLVTTRQARVADEIALADQIVRLDALTDAESLELLALLAAPVVKSHGEACRALVTTLGGLPIAIHVAARLLRTETRRGFDVHELLDALRVDARRLYESSDVPAVASEHSMTIARLLEKSTSLLDDDMRQRFATLSQLAPKPSVFDVDLAAAAWGEADPRAAIGELVDRGLVECIAPGVYQMHALFVLHANEILVEGASSVSVREVRLRLARHYAELLRTEAPRAGDDGLERLEQSWPNVQRSIDWAVAHATDREVAEILAGIELDWRLCLRLTRHDRRRWLEAQLAASREVSDRRCEARALIGLARSLVDVHGEFARALELFEAARRRAVELGDTKLSALTAVAHATAVREKWATWTSRDRALLEPLVVRLRAALADLDADDGAVRLEILCELCLCLHQMADESGEGEAALAEAERIAERTANPVRELGVLRVRMTTRAPVESIERRQRRVERALRLSERAGFRSQRMLCFHAAMLCLEGGDLDSGELWIDRVRELERGAPLERTSRVWEAMRLALAGRFDASEQITVSHHRELSAHGFTPERLDRAIGSQRFLLAYLRGEAAQFERFARMGVESLDPHEAEALAPAALAATLSGDARLAARRLQRARPFRQPHDQTAGLALLWLAAEAAAESDAPDVSRELIGALAPYAGRVATGGAFYVCLGPVDRSLGRLQLAVGDPARATRHLSRAVALTDRLKSPPWRALSELDLARALFRRRGPGDVEEALASVARVEAAAADLGMKRLHSQARALSAIEAAPKAAD